MPSAPRSFFKISAKNIFLTYPHCSLSKQEALSQLQSLQTPTNMKFIQVCRELHEDGQPHLHVLIRFEGMFQTTNRRFFDLSHPNSQIQFHPSLQGVNSSSSVKSYMDKIGDTVQWGEFQVNGRARGGRQTIKDSYAKAINSGSMEMALQTMKEEQPWYFLLNLKRLISNLEKIFTPPIEVFVSKWDPSSFVVPEDVEQWLGDVFVDPAVRPVTLKECDKPMSIIIEGPTRTGKTQWARSLGKHNYLSGYLDFNSRCYSNDAVYNVIDHVTPSDLKKKHWKELIGAQMNWKGKVKYGRRAQIKGGIPSIVLCNPDDSFKDFLEKPRHEALKHWTYQNARFVTITGPMFRYERDTRLTHNPQK